MLGMKPQQLGDVANELAEVVTGETHLLSILAGVSLADLAARFPAARAQVRILPNLAARIGAGVSAVASQGNADEAAISNLLGPLGTVVALTAESTMDLVTAFPCKIGRASCREGGGQVVRISVGEGKLQKKKKYREGRKKERR